MSYNKAELLLLPTDERRELACDLLNSVLIDEAQDLPQWKKEFIEARLKYDKDHNTEGTNWKQLKQQYFQK